MFTKRRTYLNVPSSFIRNTLKYGNRSGVSIRKRLTKQIVVCLCNGKFSSEKEGLLAHTLTWMNLRIVTLGQNKPMVKNTDQ